MAFRRALLLAAVLLALGASEARAMDPTRLAAIRIAVRNEFAVILSPGDNPARFRIYDCDKRSCRVWVHGTSDCEGVVRVRETRTNYVVWFKRLHCD